MSDPITEEQLSRLNNQLLAQRAKLFAAVLSAALVEFGITTAIRTRHFIAQVMQETGGLRSLVESTNYTNATRLDALFRNVQGEDHARRLIAAGPEAIGNTIYANKNGNGGVASGDGFRYRGRGFLQVTGRANYRSLGELLGQPLEAQPESLGEPVPAARAAAAFWQARHINAAADADDISTVTFLVNGPARLHLNERTEWLRKAEHIWIG
jgi:putative chitinase